MATGRDEMGGHITAAELRELGHAAHQVRCYPYVEGLDRAAAALDAKDARIAELENQLADLSETKTYRAEFIADAELGALGGG